jgi:hypothetical protein
MNSSSHSPVSHVRVMSFVLFASLILFVSRAAAQDLGTVTDTNGDTYTTERDTRYGTYGVKVTRKDSEGRVRGEEWKGNKHEDGTRDTLEATAHYYPSEGRLTVDTTTYRPAGAESPLATHKIVLTDALGTVIEETNEKWDEHGNKTGTHMRVDPQSGQKTIEEYNPTTREYPSDAARAAEKAAEKAAADKAAAEKTKRALDDLDKLRTDLREGFLNLDGSRSAIPLPKTDEKPVETPKETPPPAPKPEGTHASLIGIVFPSDSRAGDHISGTVVLDPKRYEKNLALRVVELQVPLAHDAGGQPVLAGATIDLGDGQPQPADRPLALTVPSGTSSVPVTTWDGPEKTGEARLPLTPSSTPVAQPTDFTAPPTCTTGTVQTVRGPFDGDARNTQITVDDKPATVLAETPRAAYWELPDKTTAGRHLVQITDHGRAVTVPVSVLTLVMTADRTTLMRGESTPFSATVAGLDTVPDSAWQHAAVPDGIDLPALASDAPGFRAPQAGDAGVVLLTITNASRDTISIDKAKNDVIVLTLDRKAVLNGKYVYQGTIRSKKSGGFRVDGLVVSFLAPVVAQPQVR